MPAFLPLLGGIAARLGSQAFLSMGGRSLAKTLAGSQKVDVSALGRRLGTPVPSGAQIKAEGFRMAEEQLVSFTGKLTKATASVASFGPAMYGVARALEGVGAATLNRRAELEQFNSGIAAAFAQIRRQEVVLGVRTGEGVAPSTRGLANAFMGLREDIQPLKEVAMRTANVLGTALVTLARGVVLILTPLTWIAEKALDLIDMIPFVSVPTAASQASLQGDLRDFFRQMRAGHFGNPINQRPGSSRRAP